MEALSSRAGEYRIDLTGALDRVAAPRDHPTAGGDSAVGGEDMIVVNIKGDAIMDDNAPLYPAEKVRIEKRCFCILCRKAEETCTKKCGFVCASRAYCVLSMGSAGCRAARWLAAGTR